ncbi:MAG: S-layer homology domain-containing protein [Tyzzerella sp.]|uniref:S-layer homology domain-containing protein n=1 Tax=Candidatus Fimicola merdigallinarum TaxID=2840819 RepID=A0A9D9DYS5_9FIRM|nr:S-layer homology domain-containing protein [Candidatus Fimicola merdigallinarum]
MKRHFSKKGIAYIVALSTIGQVSPLTVIANENIILNEVPSSEDTYYVEDNAPPESEELPELPNFQSNGILIDTYTASQIFAVGSGTQEDPYLISTLEQFKSFRDSVNSGVQYGDTYIKLTDDIDLNNENWIPIGNAKDNIFFAGYFDGDGHTISNLKIDGITSQGIGLFGYTSNSYGGVSNLTVHNVDINTTTFYTGAVFGYSASVNDNIKVTGDIKVLSSTSYVGVICGCNQGIISNSSVSGNTTNVSGTFNVGAIAGYSKGTISNSSVSGNTTNISGTYNIGVICGRNQGTVSNSSVDGNFNVTINSYYGGAVVGNNDAGGVISECSVLGEGTIKNTNTSYGYLGGLAGTNYGQINNCNLNGTLNIEAEGSYLGGVVGITNAGSSVSGCNVYGSLSVSCKNSMQAYVGGIAGFSNVPISNCNVEAKITLFCGNKSGRYVGGIVGKTNSYIVNCSVDGISKDESKFSATTDTDIITGNTLYRNIQYGGITGLQGTDSAYIKNCSVKNISIFSYYDVGAISGSITEGAYIQDCISDNVDIFYQYGISSSDSHSVGIVVGGRVSNSNSTDTGQKSICILDCSYKNTVIKHIDFDIYITEIMGNLPDVKSCGLAIGSGVKFDDNKQVIAGNFIYITDNMYDKDKYMLTNGLSGDLIPKDGYVAAKIGDKEYSTLEDALKSAKEGDTVVLQVDIVNGNPKELRKLMIPLGVSLDGNGHKLTGNLYTYIYGGTESNPSKITNVVFENITGDGSASGVALQGENIKNTLEISNCKFINIDHDALRLLPEDGANIEILNNRFEVTDDAKYKTDTIIYFPKLTDTDYSITMTGNIIKGDLSKISQRVLNILKIGDVENKNLSGNYVDPELLQLTTVAKDGKQITEILYPIYKEDMSEPIDYNVLNKIGELRAKPYESFVEAVNNAEENNAYTVFLLDDVSVDEIVEFKSGVLLDCNEKTISFSENGKIIIENPIDCNMTVPDGYTLERTILDDGRYEYKPVNLNSMEASINGVYYPTFVEAIGNSKAGETVTILKDIVVSEDVVIPSDVTVDRNGHLIYLGENGSITSETDIKSSLSVETGYTLVINITIEGKYKYTAVKNEDVDKLGEASINGVYYLTFVEAIGNSNAGETITILKDIVVSEDVVIPRDVTVDRNGHLIYVGENGSITSETDIKSSLSAETGYTLVTTITADGKYKYTVVKNEDVEEDFEASINGVFYGKLEDSVKASKNGDTIFLLKDNDISSTLSIPEGVKIDGNGNIILINKGGKIETYYDISDILEAPKGYKVVKSGNSENGYIFTVDEIKPLKPSKPSNNSSSSSDDDDDRIIIETIENADGSVTEIHKTESGSVIQTVVTKTDKDGTTFETVEKVNGSTVTTTTKAETVDGTTSITISDSEGNSTSYVNINKETLDKNDIVKLPLNNINTSDSSKNPTISIDVYNDSETKIEIPVNNMTAGTVAVLVNDDGTKEIIKSSIMGENGVIVSIGGNATLEVIDNSKFFIDVPETYWGRNSVEFTTSRELFSGTSDITFSPDYDMTRAMFITVLARFDNQDTSGRDTWYSKAVDWAMRDGVSDGTNLHNTITREQIVSMLYRYIGKPPVNNYPVGFDDWEDVSDYAKDAMSWAVQEGIIKGMGDNTICPTNNATRAQVATIMMKFVQGEYAK